MSTRLKAKSHCLDARPTFKSNVRGAKLHDHYMDGPRDHGPYDASGGATGRSCLSKITGRGGRRGREG
eukprot:3269200-Pyramimonas_sp.AAC.1